MTRHSDLASCTVSAPSHTPPVLSDLRDGVGTITLNRPKKLNAVTIQLARELECALADLSGRARVIVIRGAGENFSVGGDFAELAELVRLGRDAVHELIDGFGSACESIAQVSVPVLAAVEGYAFAGGFELMQACDFAVVRTDAQIGDHHARFGQVPGGGSSQRLPRLIGRQAALGLMMTGDHITGAKAAEVGLAYRAASPNAFESELRTMTARLVKTEPAALATIKRLVYTGAEQPLSVALAAERDAIVEHLVNGAGHAGITSFVGADREAAG